MTKLKRAPRNMIADDASQRLRAAWLYYSHKLTQAEVAAQLGISRATVIRLLDEAMKRSEVQISIQGTDRDCLSLAMQLEQMFKLDEAIVVPRADDPAAAAQSVGMALGTFLSETITGDLSIGVGWGRTLTAALASFRPTRQDGAKVISMLGGIMEARHDNPVDFSWRLASQLGAECYLYPAPLLVDSAETKQILRERCHLNRLDELAASLDLAVFSVGDIGPSATSLSRPLMSPGDYDAIVAQGGVCDLMCNVLDADGASIDHPINRRVMSIDLGILKQAAHVVIATGGAGRAAAIRAAMRRVGCHTLITDEGAAKALLDG